MLSSSRLGHPADCMTMPGSLNGLSFPAKPKLHIANLIYVSQRELLLPRVRSGFEAPYISPLSVVHAGVSGSSKKKKKKKGAAAKAPEEDIDAMLAEMGAAPPAAADALPTVPEPVPADAPAPVEPAAAAEPAAEAAAEGDDDGDAAEVEGGKVRAHCPRHSGSVGCQAAHESSHLLRHSAVRVSGSTVAGTPVNLRRVSQAAFDLTTYQHLGRIR